MKYKHNVIVLSPTSDQVDEYNVICDKLIGDLDNGWEIMQGYSIQPTGIIFIIRKCIGGK